MEASHLFNGVITLHELQDGSFLRRRGATDNHTSASHNQRRQQHFGLGIAQDFGEGHTIDNHL